MMNSMSQVKIYRESFIKGLTTLTGLPLEKVQEYAEENNPFNILEHPRTIGPTKRQLEKIGLLNEFISNYQLLKMYEGENRLKLDSSTKAGQYFISLLGGVKDKEKFLVAFLDNGNHVIETRKISEGSLGEAVVYPREVLKAAIACDCKSMILAHNHPGLSLDASEQDRMLTQRLVDIFTPLDIKVMDHIIVAGTSYTSMAERGYMPQNTKALASYEPIAVQKDRAVEENYGQYGCENVPDTEEEEEWEL